MTLPFTPGTLVRLVGDPQQIGAFQESRPRGGQPFARVQFPGGLRWIPLDQLEPVPAAQEEPLEFLRSGRLSEPRRLRQVLAHIRLTGRLADMIYSMEATNTEFHAHQFKPVLKMLGSPTSGLLIADEVGLGKTIEAGLIWTELRARFDCRNLLVVCPKVLCGKWEAELSRKFGLDARVLGAGDLLRLLQDGERMRRGNVVIGSLQGLAPPRGWDDEAAPAYGRDSARLARFLRDREDEESLFDLVVIDEAHHLRNPGTQRNLLGRLLRPVAEHRVLLSATPIHLRNRDLFSLLTLLDPETFRREQDFDDIVEANRPLIRGREAALSGRPKAAIVELIEEADRHPLLCHTKQLAALLDEVAGMGEALSRAERARLADRLEQVNLLANVVNRTRRRDVQELRVIRRVHAYRAPLTELEREVYERVTLAVHRYAAARDGSPGFLLAMPQRLLASCLPAAVAHWRERSPDFGVEDEEDLEDGTDEAGRPLVGRLAELCASLPTPAELAAEDSKFGAFLRVVRAFLTDHPGEKIVVFSTFRATLHYLRDRLKAEGIGVALIHGQVEDREGELERFADDDRVRVLLSSEVGSEGIDLQFCRAVVNYDLPWNPMRVEQRIGRVDRFGQAADAISVINLLSADTIDDRIYRRLYERLDLCRNALGDFEAVLGDEIRQLTTDLLVKRLTPEEQEQRIDQTSQAIETRRRQVEELEQEAAALIAHGDHVLRSIHEARDKNRWIGPKDLQGYIVDTLGTLHPGCGFRELEDGICEITLTLDARRAYRSWLDAHRLPQGGLLAQEYGPVRCRLGRPATGRSRRQAIEAITQTHPFVRFLAAELERTEAPKLRPAVAALLPASRCRIDLAPGCYAVVAELWRFGGQVETEKVVFGGLDLMARRPMAEDDAELLLLAAAEHGSLWPGAEAEIDTAAVADDCETILLDGLQARFDDERRARGAEQEDRASIQLRTLERREKEQVGRLRELIGRQRRDQRVKGSIIAANEGKLRKLEEAIAARRREIEEQRSISSQREFLIVAVIRIIDNEEKGERFL
ncbi:SNF2-related protein [Benzoatithermus flavus]|uniref:SNF2-related protein n=1 Tax=Benzoatithermus flavus TaxID=3108223 RepID=A0ABU8XS19_9PROT